LVIAGNGDGRGGAMTLSLYLARRFYLTVGVVTAAFAGILMLIDMVEQIRRHAGNPDAGLAEAAQVAALNLAGGLYRILPLVVMLGSVALFLALARSSELVVIRAAGRSAIPALAAFVLGAVAVAMLNPLVAATARLADDVSARLSGSGVQSVLSVSREGLWLRQGNPEGQTVIRAARANLDGTELLAVSFIDFDAGGQPVARIEAEAARLTPGFWTLEGVKQWRLTDANPEKTATRAESARLATDLTPARIRESFSAPDAVGIWDLPAFIAGLERAGFSARKHQVWLQRELALPLTLAAMVLLAAGFTMRHVRFGRSGTMVLMAVLAGFAMFFLRNFAQVLGENGQIPVALAAWAPPAVALLAALGLLVQQEEG
jgi:lipopolysaccharide export system permease protein